METENLKHLCGIHLEEARLRKKNITTVSIVTSIILIICASLISNIESTSKHLVEELESVYSQLGKENELDSIHKELTMAGLEILKDNKLSRELIGSIETFIELAKENIGKERPPIPEISMVPIKEIQNENIEIGNLLNRNGYLKSTNVAINQLQNDLKKLEELYDLHKDKNLEEFTNILVEKGEDLPRYSVEIIMNRYYDLIEDKRKLQYLRGDPRDFESPIPHTTEYIGLIISPLYDVFLLNKDIIDKYNKINDILKSNNLINHSISTIRKDYSNILANINKLAELMGVSVEEKYYKMVNGVPVPEQTRFLSVIRKIKEDAKNKIAESKEESKVVTKIYGFEISLSVGSLIFMFPVVFSLYIPMIYMMIVQYHIHLNTGAAFEKKILSNSADNHNIDPEIIWQVKGIQKGFGNWLCYPGRLQQNLFQLFIGIMMIYIIYRSYVLIEMIHSFFYLMVYVGIMTTSFGIIAWLTIIILRKEIPKPIYQPPAGVQGNLDKT